MQTICNCVRPAQAQEQAQAEMAAALEAEELQVQEQEWNMAELERMQEQQVCLVPDLLQLSAMCLTVL